MSQTKEHAMQTSIVVFTKVPKSGETKTRLTTDRGGVLTHDEARMLYEGCLVDVLNVCLKADCGAVKVCYNADGDPDCLEQLLARSSDRSKIVRSILTGGAVLTAACSMLRIIS